MGQLTTLVHFDTHLAEVVCKTATSEKKNRKSFFLRAALGCVTVFYTRMQEFNTSSGAGLISLRDICFKAICIDMGEGSHIAGWEQKGARSLKYRMTIGTV